ncbi:MAG: hypothetical protein OHK0017_13910 [Patescibacteria group bacterium]
MQNSKTVFPEIFDAEDIAQVGKQFKSSAVRVLGQNYYEATITQKGVTLNVRGYMNFIGEPATWFPI